MRANRMHVLGSPAVGALLLTIACGDTGPDVRAVVREDSAGIRIVETLRAVWADGGSWSVDPQPALEIGELEGESPYLFGELRGAIRLGDGSIVAVDNQAREVRWFDAQGRFLRAVGGPGEGPTEFPRSAWRLERCGLNRLYVLDLFATRILSWDTVGGFQRGFMLTEPGSATRRPYNDTCREDGGFIAIGWGESDLPPLREGLEAQAYQQYASTWLLDSVGALEVEFGSYLASERIRQRRGSGPHPFGHAARFAERNGTVFIGAGEGLSVAVHTIERTTQGRDGFSSVTGLRAREIWRAETDDLRFEQNRDAYAQADVSGADLAFRDLILEGVIEPPDQLPGYTELQVTPDGHLWAKRFIPPWESIERWGVFAPDGVFLGNIELPVGLRVTEIGDHHVLGISTDELGVERIHLHVINR